MLLPCLAASMLCVQHARSGAVSVEDPPGPFGVELALGLGEQLLQYAWDGRAPVSFLAPGAHVFVPYGERGLGPNVRLYLAGNSSLEASLSGASVLQQTLVGAAEGRFGPGLFFGGTSRLRVALPPQDPTAIGWTLSSWLRPENAAFGRRAILLPGALEVFLQSDGRAVAHLLPSGEQIVHPRALEAGVWAHLVVSYDPSLTSQMRFLVDGEAYNVNFGIPTLARVASELVAGDVFSNSQGFVGTLDELTLEALPLSTAEARRAARRRLAPGIHPLELVTTRGLRSLEPAADPSRELGLDSAADFAPGQLDGVALENGVLRWVPGRWRELTTNGKPPPRTTHPTVALGAGRVWIFDGETRDTHLNPMRNTSDTWILHLDSKTWERIATATAPSPRCHVPAAFSPDHDLVLLHGGWKNDTLPGVSYGDTWVYRVTERRWEQRFPGGASAPDGSDFGLVYLPQLGQFLLFAFSTTYLYDPLADLWQIRPAPSAIDENGQPTSYVMAGSSMVGVDPGTGLVVLFGGASGPQATTFHDQTALYDVAANRFTVLDPPVHPSARVRSGFAYDSQRGLFVLFGGVRDQYSVRYDDLWVFDPAARTWTELGCSNRPSRRGGYFGMAYDEQADEFVLQAGRSTPEVWLDETQVLQLRPASSGVAVYTFDRLEDWNKAAWQADVVTPGDSSVSFTFRWSDSGKDWSSWRLALTRLGRARFVQVAAVLQPGSAGEVPEILRMGLR